MSGPVPEPITAERLGDNIRRAITASGLTQRQVAERTELDPTALSKILSGKRKVSSLELALICTATGSDVLGLLEADPLHGPSFRAGMEEGWRNMSDRLAEIERWKEAVTNYEDAYVGEHEDRVEAEADASRLLAEWLAAVDRVAAAEKKADNQRRFYREEIVRREKAESEVERLRERLARMTAIARWRGDALNFADDHLPTWQAIRDERDRLVRAVEAQREEFAEHPDWVCLYETVVERLDAALAGVPAGVHEMLWGIELRDGATYGVTPNTRQEAERVATTVPGAKVREVRNCRWSGVTLYDVLAPPAEVTPPAEPDVATTVGRAVIDWAVAEKARDDAEATESHDTAEASFIEEKSDG